MNQELIIGKKMIPSHFEINLWIYEKPSRTIVCMYNYFLFYKMKLLLYILLQLPFFIRIYAEDQNFSSYID